jgi:tight adherence protein C
MTLTWVLLGLGAATGVGLWLLLVGLFPPRPALAVQLAAIHRRPPAVAPVVVSDGDAAGNWTARLGRPAVAVLTRAGLPTAGVRRDLAAMGRTVEAHLAEQATTAVLGLALPMGIAAVLSIAGLNLGLVLPAIAGAVLAALGLIVPVMALRSEAVKHRAAYRHALSAYLDLVTVSLAGGAGTEEAMTDAATVGAGPAFAELRHALTDARLTRTPPWQALGRLGERVGVPELVELAGTVELAGAEGARVRQSLKARAAALRGKRLSDTEAVAAAATERMSLPVVLLFAGFLVFLGYPAASIVMAGLA